MLQRRSSEEHEKERQLQKKVTDLSNQVHRLEKKVSLLKQENETLVSCVENSGLVYLVCSPCWEFCDNLVDNSSYRSPLELLNWMAIAGLQNTALVFHISDITLCIPRCFNLYHTFYVCYDESLINGCLLRVLGWFMHIFIAPLLIQVICLQKKKSEELKLSDEKIKKLKKRNAELAAIARRLEWKAKQLQQESSKVLMEPQWNDEFSS